MLAAGFRLVGDGGDLQLPARAIGRHPGRHVADPQPEQRGTDR
jgi:hypothetical protein